MSSKVSIYEIAKAANVSICTVSRIVNGRTTGVRLSNATRQRVLAIARQMNYQADPVAQNIALGLGAPPRPAMAKPAVLPDGEAPIVVTKKRQQVGVILSITSSPETLGLLPSLIPTLAAANYGVAIVTLPADPVSARQQVIQLLDEGVAGLLCCPTLYVAVSEIAGSEKPVGSGQWAVGRPPIIVLWQGAAKAMVKSVGGGEPVSSGQVAADTEPVPVTPLSEPVFTQQPTTQQPLTAAPPPLEPEPVTTTPPPIDPALPNSVNGLSSVDLQLAIPLPPTTINQDPTTAAPPPITLNPITNNPGAVAPDDPCPCGSGKKFKKCHGKWGAGQTTAPTPHPELDLIFTAPASPTTIVSFRQQCIAAFSRGNASEMAV